MQIACGCLPPKLAMCSSNFAGFLLNQLQFKLWWPCKPSHGSKKLDIKKATTSNQMPRLSEYNTVDNVSSVLAAQMRDPTNFISFSPQNYRKKKTGAVYSYLQNTLAVEA